jgi:RHS repeat-associated protein
VTSRSITNGTSLLTYTLAYDGLDHLVRWNDLQTTANEEWYMYDGTGQRVLRRSQTGTGTSNTKYTVYAFGVQDDVYDGSGVSNNNKYYYSLAGHLIGELNGGTKFLLTDLLGSVVASISNTANSAAVLGNQVYGPYGDNPYSKGTITTPKGYTGQYNDALTTLDYFNARYYDPAVGVFLSADSKQGNPQGMNPYAYVNGNPETKSDPTGHRPVPIGGEGDGGGYVPPPPPPTWFRAASELEAQLMGAQYKKQPPPSDSSIAYDLGLSVEGDRHDKGWFPPPGKTGGLKAGTNGAAGEWYITDPEGNLIEYGSMLIGDSFISYSLGGPNRHAERLLLVNMLTSGATTTGMFLKMLEAGGGGLHFVVFTQLAPCGKCQAYFSEFLSGMKQQLEDFTNQADIFGAELGAADNDENQYTVSLSVWATAYQDVYYTGGSKNANNFNVDAVGLFGVANYFDQTTSPFED